MNTFPSDYDSAPCVLAPINVRIVPYVAGALAKYEKPAAWATFDDYRAGYNAIAEVQACMTALCARDLVQAQERLYRLLDTALLGTAYSVTGTDPDTLEPIISPPIPDVPATTAVLPGLVQRVARLEALLDNAYNGTLYLEYDQTPSLRQELENIRTQLAQLNTELDTKGELDDDMLIELGKVVLALA